jgi:hypothetical protein
LQNVILKLLGKFILGSFSNLDALE